jgi:hypothetical protein
MHNDTIGRVRGAIKAMKTLELIIAFNLSLWTEIPLFVRTKKLLSRCATLHERV